jgi:hypothetical protein
VEERKEDIEVSRKNRTNAEGLLRCSRKDHYLPREAFYDRPRVVLKKSGELSDTASAWCKDCVREYMLAYSKRKKKGRE